MDIYVFYLDTYFIENACLNQIFLALTLILMGRKIRFRRLLAASAAGSGVSVLAIALGMNYTMAYMLLFAAAALGMVSIATGRQNKSEWLAGALYFCVLSFAGNRLFEGLARLIGARYVLCGIGAAAIMGMAAGYLYKRGKRRREQTIYPVEIIQQGQKLSIKALLDTGNTLREPISGRPVSVIEKDLYEEACLPKPPCSFRAIPYHSIGKPHGILQGMEVETLIIWKDAGPYIEKNAMLALYDGKLNAKGSYQMILHSSLL